MRRSTPAIVLLLLAGTGGLGWIAWERTGPAPVRAEGIEALDPLVCDLLEREVAQVARHTRSREPRLRLGMAYEANGLFGEATRCYEQVLEAWPNDGKALHRLACAQERLGDLALAERTMTRSAEAEPDYAGTWTRLLWWRTDLGDVEGAAEALGRAAVLASEDPAVRFGAVRLELARGHPAQAAALVRDGGLLGGDEAPFANHLLAIALRELGDAEGAARAQAASSGRRLTLADPWALEVLRFETGYAAMRLRAGREVQAGRYAEAEERLRALVEHDPQDAQSLNMLGVCRLQRGDAAGAVTLFERVLELEPGDPGAAINHARALLRLGPAAGELDAAARRVDRATTARPDDPLAWRVAAALADARGRPSEAIRALDRAAELEPEAVDVRLQAAYTLLVEGDFDGALERFLAVQQRFPETTEAWFGEVATLAGAGRADAAREALARLERRPDADAERLARLRATVDALR